MGVPHGACLHVLGWAHLSDEWDSKIWPGHGQHGMLFFRQSAVLWVERLAYAAKALSEFDLYTLLNSCSRSD